MRYHGLRRHKHACNDEPDSRSQASLSRRGRHDQLRCVACVRGTSNPFDGDTTKPGHGKQYHTALAAQLYGQHDKDGRGCLRSLKEFYNCCKVCHCYTQRGKQNTLLSERQTELTKNGTRTRTRGRRGEGRPPQWLIRPPSPPPTGRRCCAPRRPSAAKKKSAVTAGNTSTTLSTIKHPNSKC